ncbi:unnamed protein product [Clonostachys rosea]|uniref:Uncharacterized protein n=1 Tax=Bionectria ochroleuca TaxID=29856 RepID=A0ABY6UPV7_BIOOC|nr:unnamed protein product [Clonostachys rosea]
MPSQRPFFLASVFAALRQQDLSIAQQPNKYATQTTASPASSSAANATATSTAAGRAANTNNNTSGTSNAADASNQAQAPRSANIPIQYPSRRRGSDSSSEGFRDVLGADKWYIGGRTAGGEERFFKLGVVRRVRSNDGLSLDRLSL